MIIKIIIPYFGKFPEHMDLFLESCRHNKEFSFLVFTDQSIPHKLPENVSFIRMEFDEVQDLLYKQLGDSATLYSPYKLCDYKPIYGYIFSDYLSDADYWGHCDIDLVFGRIMEFYGDRVFGEYEKIQTQGHLVFYKNTLRMNEMFKNYIPAGIMVDEMMKTKEPCFFDEIMFPAICRNNNVSLYECKIFADILPQYSTFRVSSALCTVENKIGQRFYWKNGNLYRVSKQLNGFIETEKMLYIHLQKRALPINYTSDDFQAKIYFTPQGIYSESRYTEDSEKPNKKHVRKYKIKRLKGFALNKIRIKLKISELRRYEKIS